MKIACLKKIIFSAVLILIIFIQINNTAVSAANLDIDYYSYDSNRLISYSGGVYSMHRGYDYVSVVSLDNSLNSVNSESFYPGYEICLFEYFDGCFYVAYYGDADYDSGMGIYIYKGYSLSSLYEVDCVRCGSSSYNSLCIDKLRNIYCEDLLLENSVKITDTYNNTTIVSFSKAISNITASTNGSYAALLENGCLRYKSCYSSEWVYTDKHSSSIRFLSDNLALLDNGCVFDLSSNAGYYLGTSFTSGCKSDNGVYLASGSVLYEYTNSFELINTCSLKGSILDVAVCGGLPVAMLNNGNKLSVSWVGDRDSGEKTLSDGNVANIVEDNDKKSDTTSYAKNEKTAFIEKGTTLSDFVKSLDNEKLLNCENISGKEIKSGKIGTGTKVTVKLKNGDNTVYTIILPGDITGEGNINSNDIEKEMGILVGSERELDEICLIAADLNNDTYINLKDLWEMGKVN